VALLEKIVQHPLEREKDWLYYARRMVDALALRISREPHLARLLVERQILRKLNKNGFAKVDLRDEDMMMLDQVFYCAAGESKKMIESYEKTYQSYAPSIEGGLDEVCYQARKEVSAAVQQIIELVKKTITKGIKKKHPEVRSYARPHTFMAEAPGRLRRRSMSIENDAVLVIDTSGSMWIPVLLDNMATLASQLTKKGLVSKTYCCDVALTPIDNIQRGEIKFTGAGGTAWTVEHNSQILKELYGEQLPEAPLTLYYCTDEMVEGLEQACLDERVNLVVINIPKILDEMTYLQASL
jgi:hypothetical protein